MPDTLPVPVEDDPRRRPVVLSTGPRAGVPGPGGRRGAAVRALAALAVATALAAGTTVLVGELLSPTIPERDSAPLWFTPPPQITAAAAPASPAPAAPAPLPADRSTGATGSASGPGTSDPAVPATTGGTPRTGRGGEDRGTRTRGDEHRSPRPVATAERRPAVAAGDDRSGPSHDGHRGGGGSGRGPDDGSSGTG